MPKLDRESAEEWLEESIRRLHHQGWLVSGSIELIDYSVCPTCGSETVWDGKEHLCTVCCVAVRLLRPTRPDYVNLAKSYLTKLVKAKGAEPLPDLMGLCTQVDNILASAPPLPPPKRQEGTNGNSGPKPSLSMIPPDDGMEENQLRRQNETMLRKTLGVSDDAPACSTCGGIMVRSGTCYKCMGCGSQSGCS